MHEIISLNLIKTNITLEYYEKYDPPNSYWQIKFILTSFIRIVVSFQNIKVML